MTALRSFDDRPALDAAVADLLRNAVSSDQEGPHAVVLSGGSTPMAVFNVLAQEDLQAAPGLVLSFTDDRHVPASSPDSNYGNTQPLIKTLGLPPERVIHVHADCPLEESAERFGCELQSFFDNGGRVSLALLGMGADGHTCSIFTPAAAADRDRLAFAVTGKAGFNRVTVSTAFLERCERIVFFVAGESKREILTQFQADPLSLPAGLATQGCPNVEIWTDAL